VIEFTLPIRIDSTANISEHWTASKRRKDRQKNAIKGYWNKSNQVILIPCKVILTRIAPRTLDLDNLLYSLKGVRDIVADLIIPGLQPGRADASDKIIFEYKQEKGKPKEYALRIQIDDA